MSDYAQLLAGNEALRAEIALGGGDPEAMIAKHAEKQQKAEEERQKAMKAEAEAAQKAAEAPKPQPQPQAAAKRDEATSREHR